MSDRWKRFEEWDRRPLRLDSFAAEDPAHGFAAFDGAEDPAPELVLQAGAVSRMDGKAAHDFDMIDTFIARHHLDLAVAAEAMALDATDLARRLVDIHVPRAELVRLARGLTPAKLAQVVTAMNGLELAFAFAKMHARRTPGNQAHVTNAKDDPLQLAADAATAVAFGFDEVETTMRVARNAWSNALACAVGASVGRRGTLVQCAAEEAEELRIGLAGFTSYAETVSVYGTERAFTDGDDTPWSKAFLAAAYASRGIKMRCTSGAGSELLMGFHESKSMLYLEARCLCLQRAMGVQGTQNGGVDGAPLAASLPGGVRELLAENLIAAWLDLEVATGNDARHSESEIRVGARILPYLLAGSDLLCSGMGSILKYDNTFNPSSFNGEEMEDLLVLQRDYEADGGLRSPAEDDVLAARRHAVDALSAVLEELKLGRPTQRMKDSVVYASGSRDTEGYEPRDVAVMSDAIRDRGLSVIDVVVALDRRGFPTEAENLLAMARLRVSGDYLQTAAVVRDGRVVSALNDPNDYQGPGTGYRLDERRRREIAGVRSVLTRQSVLAEEDRYASSHGSPGAYLIVGEARPPGAKNEVVIGISPAAGVKLFRTLAGHSLRAVLATLCKGIRRHGGQPRVVRMHHSADTSFLGLRAAELSGSGVGIGLQAKGTAVIHQVGRLPHHNLELFSNAPVTTLAHYERFAENAAAYAEGGLPEPVVVSTEGQALGARHHVRVALLHAIETARVKSDGAPEELDVAALEAEP